MILLKKSYLNNLSLFISTITSKCPLVNTEIPFTASLTLNPKRNLSKRKVFLTSKNKPEKNTLDQKPEMDLPLKSKPEPKLEPELNPNPNSKSNPKVSPKTL